MSGNLIQNSISMLWISWESREKRWFSWMILECELFEWWGQDDLCQRKQQQERRISTLNLNFSRNTCSCFVYPVTWKPLRSLELGRFVSLNCWILPTPRIFDSSSHLIASLSNRGGFGIITVSSPTAGERSRDEIVGRWIREAGAEEAGEDQGLETLERVKFVYASSHHLNLSVPMNHLK